MENDDRASMSGRRVLLGVTGGIAAYKSAELCRMLVRQGARVQVVMSAAACNFITPLTMATLSDRAVPVDMFERADGGVNHIALADDSELLLVAPATADYLARCAQGRANDLISALTLAFTGPVLAAPAMNTNMWNNPATRRNVATLAAEHGWRFVQPGTGELACGWSGPGRMAEPDEILAAAQALLSGDLTGLKLLVTAGPTVEDIDPVRYLTNRSSGRMGYALAERAARRGARVVLISGPVALAPAAGAEVVSVRSATEMEAAVNERAGECDVVIMAAAVSDYRPVEPSEHKLKKPDDGSGLTVDLVQNPDILAGLGRRYRDANRPLLVGFALETRELLAAAEAKLKAKGVQIIVANPAADALMGETTSAIIIDDRGQKMDTGTLRKDALADKILDLIRTRTKKENVKDAPARNK
jgi:phosphopantothenoylcysteine decarboxylase/phosphopantothenate--cysteine ligase